MDFDSDTESLCSSSASSASDYLSDDEIVHENAHPNATPQKTKKGDRTNNIASSSTNARAGAAASGKSTKKTIEQTYQKKTQLEHILLRPDTYIGSTEQITQPMFVLNSDTQRIESRDVTFTPGFYKIFDEIIVNAADNKQRDPDMDRMEVVVDADTNTISVMNNGKGIPVVMHKEHNCYVPTLIFGHLLTGSNFDDNEKKTTGGRNGYGAKLANIFSTKFVVECCDSEQGLKFSQTFRDNMRTAEEPKITKCSSSEKKRGDCTKITFRPDLEKFNMSSLDDDAIGLISKRAYDIAGAMGKNGGKKLSVYLNNKKIPVKDFKSYLALFDGVEMPTVIENMDNFEVGVTVSADGCFQQISFVNGIATTKGGGHVNFIADKVAKHIQPIVNKKNKGGSKITPAQIKNHLSVFVNCLVENPTFDSQTKENLTTKPSIVGKAVTLSDKFLKQVEKSGIIESVMNYTKFKQSQALKRKGGTKKSKLQIDKLDDANHAGTAKSKDCTLIITEGDSAKSLAMSGLSVVGRDYYGVFPLKGKPLNVRDASHSQIMKNQEIKNLIDIMGLKFGTAYDESNIKSLRYGHLMIMADQDHDGSHIKGLVISFIHHFWPSLLDVPGFLQQFITPIVKCTKGKQVKTFFTLPEYEEWKESTGNDAKGWTTKYYKGLGTSTSAEAKEYFSNLDIHEITFNTISDDIVSFDDADEMSDNSPSDAISTGAGLIDMAFSKSKVEERKKWLNCFDKDTFLNYSDAQKNGINYSDFINKELILFSKYDCTRSIPHVLDGLKPSQRKVLFSCFKKKLKNEIKVAQLAGYVGEHSSYHHGEMSLTGAIINMAQSYVGSNNINLLYPSGQFGTRRMGGNDHASARYIFTRLEKVARTIFHPDDDVLLNYLNDDGLSIEPEYYVPIIPLILVNGTHGIGTGWSSRVPNHDPREIIATLRKMINGEEPEAMHPCYYGFEGEIISEKKEGTYTITGKIERADDTTLTISELPVGKWTQNYKTFLEEMMTGTDKSPSEISDFKEHHTDTRVAFTIKASKENIDAFEKTKGGLVSKFKLSTTISTNNMFLFDVDGKIHKYKATVDILRTFFHHRLEFYVKRKNMLLEKMRKELKVLENKARFVEEVCKGELVVSKRKRTELLAELSEKGYELHPRDEKKMDSEEDDNDEEVEESASDAELAKGYEYLLGLKLWTLTFERAQDIRRQKVDKEAEVEALESTTPESIWLADLDELDKALVERNKSSAITAKKAIRSQTQPTSRKRTTKQAKAATKKSTLTKKKDADEWNSELEESDSDGAASSSDDDMFEDEMNERPVKKIAGLGTRAEQTMDIQSQSDAESDESPKKMPAKKKSTKREQVEVELIDSDESAAPKKVSSSRKKGSDGKSKSRHSEATLPTSSKSSTRLSANGKQKVAVLGTRAQQRKSLSVTKVKSTSATKKPYSMQLGSNSDEFPDSPEKIPKKSTKRKKSIVNQALQAEAELVDSDESPAPKKASSKRRKLSLAKSSYLCDSDSDSDDEFTPNPVKISKKKVTKRSSICHLSSDDDESDGYESPQTNAHKRKRLTKPKRSFASSDEDDFEF